MRQHRVRVRGGDEAGLLTDPDDVPVGVDDPVFLFDGFATRVTLDVEAEDLRLVVGMDRTRVQVRVREEGLDRVTRSAPTIWGLTYTTSRNAPVAPAVAVEVHRRRRALASSVAKPLLRLDPGAAWRRARRSTQQVSDAEAGSPGRNDRSRGRWPRSSREPGDRLPRPNTSDASTATPSATRATGSAVTDARRHPGLRRPRRRPTPSHRCDRGGVAVGQPASPGVPCSAAWGRPRSGALYGLNRSRSRIDAAGPPLPLVGAGVAERQTQRS